MTTKVPKLRRVLELNNSWIPYCIRDPSDAFRLMVKHKAKAIDKDDNGNFITYTFDEWIEYKCGEINDVIGNMNTYKLTIPIP